MDSTSEHRDSLTSFSPDCLSNEDCRYLLRVLEKRAFEYIVCAFRAQGKLSQYKEVVLDHLKSLFFISDEDFTIRFGSQEQRSIYSNIFSLRLSANDPLLSKIAEELNPSYDNSSEWLSAGYSLVALDFPQILQLSTSLNSKAASCAQEMISQMEAHNSNLGEEKDSFQKLLHLQKKIYVPEKLRRLLHDSEKDVHGRIDVIKEKKGPSATNKNPSIVRHVGRPRKSEQLQGSTSLENARIKNAKNDVSRSYSLSVPMENGSSHLKNSTSKEGLRVQNEFSIHYSAGANVVVIDPEDQTCKEPKTRKRKSKHVDDITCVCARVQPFIFKRPLPGQIKVPRGNPDKRTTKRSAHAGFPASNDFVNSSYVHSHHHIGIPSNYYPKNLAYIPTNVDPELLSAKRTRAASVGEDGMEKEHESIRHLQPQQMHMPPTQHLLPKIFRPAFIHRPSNYVGSNLKTNGTLPMGIQQSSTLKTHRMDRSVPPSTNHPPFRPNDAKSAGSQQAQAIRNAPSTLPTQSQKPRADPPQVPNISTNCPAPTSIDGDDVDFVGSSSGASGLDFLASTASLLAPIPQQKPNTISKEATPCSSGLQQTISATSVVGVNDNDTLQTLATQANVMDQASTSKPTKPPMSASSSKVPANLRPPTDDQKAQNFFKKHALVENGAIDEETTLGSILADPALRNKFMAAIKPNTSTTTQALTNPSRQTDVMPTTTAEYTDSTPSATSTNNCATVEKSE